MKKILETTLLAIEQVYCGEDSCCDECMFFIEKDCKLGRIENAIVDLPFIIIPEVE